MDFKHYLHSMFNPTAIAVVGVSDKPDSLGALLWQHLQEAKAFAKLFPVNSKLKNIGDEKCFSKIADIKEPIDLVVLAEPPEYYEKVLAECMQLKVGSVLLCGGYPKSEITEKIKEKIAECAKSGVKIAGPQSLGILHPSRKLNASFLPEMPAEGGVGLISQSPGLVSSMIEIALEHKAGFSFVIDPGMEQELLAADYLDMMASDPMTTVVVLYLETFRNPRKLLSAVRLASRTKPVILLKGGQSRAAEDIVVNNNSVPHRSGKLMDRALEKAGALLVNSVQDFASVIQAFSFSRKFSAGSVYGLVNSKGLDTLMADSLDKCHVQIAKTDPSTASELAEKFHIPFPYANPINAGLNASPEVIANLAAFVLTMESCGGLLMAIGVNPMSSQEEIAKALVPVLKDNAKPVVTVWIGSSSARKAIAHMQKNGIPALDDIEAACLTIGLMEKFRGIRHAKNQILQAPASEPAETYEGVRKIVQKAKRRKRNLIYEEDAKRMLASLGIHTAAAMEAGSIGEAREAAFALGYPVAMKLRTDGVLSKSEVNGVILGIRNEDELQAAWDALKQRAENALISRRDFGVLVQKMITDKNLRELKVGFRTTDQFGPMVYVGIGGLYGSLGYEPISNFVPLTKADAKSMLETSEVRHLLSECKGMAAVDPEPIAEILLKLSQLATVVPALRSLEIDPLLCGGQWPIVLDANAVTGPLPLEADEKFSHLVFPVTNNLKEINIKGNFGNLVLKSAEPADAEAFKKYLDSLSQHSRQQRFHGASSDEVIITNALTSDPDRSLCLFSRDREGRPDEIVAEAMFSILPNGTSAEFGISVKDSWQKMGLSGPLMSALEENARKFGLKQLIGYVLNDNEAMKRMMLKRGYAPTPDESDPHITLYTLEL
ncbi:MAG: GNAT family N-acetyltransferase [Burkholderiales bacterium]|nr:GNAT family N-acetyltransferase [Burkholderiales bacterium]